MVHVPMEKYVRVWVHHAEKQILGHDSSSLSFPPMRSPLAFPPLAPPYLAPHEIGPVGEGRQPDESPRRLPVLAAPVRQPREGPQAIPLSPPSVAAAPPACAASTAVIIAQRAPPNSRLVVG